MYDFAVRELQQASSDGGDAWAANEIARLYQDSGGYQRAIEYIKKTVPAYWSMDYAALPRPYWEYLFPRPYWTDLRKFSLLNGLDPFLVASLIRQESRVQRWRYFSCQCCRLMQLLPGTGKTVAREFGFKGIAVLSCWFQPRTCNWARVTSKISSIDTTGASNTPWLPTTPALTASTAG